MGEATYWREGEWVRGVRLTNHSFAEICRGDHPEDKLGVGKEKGQEIFQIFVESGWEGGNQFAETNRK